MNMRLVLSSLALVLASTFAVRAFAQDKPAGDKPAPTGDAAAIQAQKGSYPLKTCPISGEALGANAVDTMVDGKLVRTCCKDCVAEISKKKADVVKAIDAAVIEQQKKAYPLEKCPISGEPLGAKAVDFVVGTKLVRTCCNDCVAEIKKDSAPALKKLDDAYVAAQKANYPLDTCPISGEKLGGMGEPVDFLYGTHLYRLCCASCKKGIVKNPDEAWAKIESARAAKKPDQKPPEKKG